jgi:hypothetical protein
MPNRRLRRVSETSSWSTLVLAKVAIQSGGGRLSSPGPLHFTAEEAAPSLDTIGSFYFPHKSGLKYAILGIIPVISCKIILKASLKGVQC